MSLKSTAAKPSKQVWVFGGGISGLTAAHELVERGFQVVVVEPEPDRRVFGRPDLGGVARTQWAVWEGSSDAARTKGLDAGDWIDRRALPLMPPVRLFFRPGTAELEEPAKQQEYIDSYCREYITEGVRWLPAISVTGFEPPGEQRDGQGNQLALERAKTVAAALRCGLGHGELLAVRESTATLPGEDESYAAAVEIALAAVHMPGEHGFRYFPAFYRHVFDTMARIRLLDDRSGPSPRPFGTVLDNLVPTRTVDIALGRGSPGLGPALGLPAKPVQIRRDLPRSLAALQESLASLLGGLGYTERDVAHLALKLTLYMTSGPGRRGKYEELTFEQFLEIEKLSEGCQRDVRAAPEVLAGMRPSESDARTQGTVTTQLLLNELTGASHSDAILNGPVSSVWIRPWREYLEAQGVTFRLGRVTGFSPVEGKGRVVPDVKFEDLVSTQGAFDGSEWFVLAVPLTALLPESAGGGALCERFLRACDGAEGGAGDLVALDKWIGHVGEAWKWDGEEQPSGPFRHVSGIQYFFGTDQRPTDGHTIYADSAWRLSSVSQLSFWTQPATPAVLYRGIISVDIGEWHTAGSSGSDAWHTEPNGLAAEVWRQIGDTLPRRPAMPSFYHLDDGVEQRASVEPGERRYEDRTPYLITRPEDWAHRPGKPGEYQIAAGRWVMCGTFMKTFTRMTTMESANESARHAVNALVRAYDAEINALRGRDAQTPECSLFPPEEHELADLTWHKKLDEALFARGLPHALDIVESQAWLDALAPR